MLIPKVRIFIPKVRIFIPKVRLINGGIYRKYTRGVYDAGHGVYRKYTD